MAADAGRVVLVGMAGTGKTTTGRALAEELGWPHQDLDDLVEAAAGATVAAIWAAGGEPAFRDLERRALRDALGHGGPLVLSTGGGVVVDGGNRALLRGAGTVVWLRATDATLAARVGDGSGRPLLAGDAAGAVARLSAERRRWYEDVADVAVDVDDRTPRQVLDAVLAAIGAPSATAGDAGGASEAAVDAGGVSEAAVDAGGVSEAAVDAGGVSAAAGGAAQAEVGAGGGTTAGGGGRRAASGGRR